MPSFETAFSQNFQDDPRYQSWLSEFLQSPTLINLLTAFADNGGVITFGHGPATEALSSTNIVVGLDNISSASAAQVAVILGHELGHASDVGGLAVPPPPLPYFANPQQAAAIGEHAEGVAMVEEYRVATELGTQMISGQEVQNEFNSLTRSGDPNLYTDEVTFAAVYTKTLLGSAYGGLTYDQFFQDAAALFRLNVDIGKVDWAGGEITASNVIVIDDPKGVGSWSVETTIPEINGGVDTSDTFGAPTQGTDGQMIPSQLIETAENLKDGAAITTIFTENGSLQVQFSESGGILTFLTADPGSPPSDLVPSVNEGAFAFSAAGNGWLSIVDGPITTIQATIPVNGTLEFLPLDAISNVALSFVFTDSSGTLQIDNPFSFSGTIFGCDFGDIIDLTGIGTATTAVLGSGNVLTVRGGTNNVTLSLDPSQDYSSDEFLVAPDTNGGTDITITPHLPPVTTVPGPETVLAGVTTPFTGLSVADADPQVASEILSVVLSDGSGLLAATAASGGTVSGLGTTSLVLTGGLDAINAELATLTYTGSAAASTDTIDVATSDGRGGSDDRKIAVSIDSEVTINGPGGSHTTITYGGPNGSGPIIKVDIESPTSSTVCQAISITYDYSGGVGGAATFGGIPLGYTGSANAFPFSLSALGLTLATGPGSGETLDSFSFVGGQITQWALELNSDSGTIFTENSDPVVADGATLLGLVEKTTSNVNDPGSWTLVGSTFGATISPLDGQTQQLSDVLTDPSVIALGPLQSLTIDGPGSVAVTGAATVQNFIVSNNGNVVLQGGLLDASSVLIDGNGNVSGFGTINGTATVQGNVTAIGGTLDLMGPLTGIGVLTIDDGTLEVGAAVALSGIAFTGGGVLQIDDLASVVGGAQQQEFDAPISGFAKGDIVRLEGFGIFPTIDGATPAYDAATNTTTLTLTDPGLPVATLTLVGDYSGDAFAVTSDSNVAGAVDIAFGLVPTPPVLTPVANQADQATGPNGAVATFAATATDLADGTDPVVFTEGNTVVKSGDTFSLGTHTITASATDTAGNTGSELFTISVVDTTPPILATIANQTVQAIGSNGAIATFAATATDLVDGTDPVVFTEGNTLVQSGDVFGIGLHMITASATDTAGNTTSDQFAINVVDTPPTVNTVTASPSSADENSGNTVTLTVTMSKVVFVTGTPVLSLNDGGTATYSNGTDTNALTFTYVVANGQNASALAVTGNNVNGSTIAIADAAGMAADLSGADITFPGLAIGATVTSISAGSPADDLGPGTKVTIAVRMSEAVKVTGGTPFLMLNDGRKATYTSGSGTNVLTFIYTVGALGSGQSVAALAVTGFNPNGATVYDSGIKADMADLSGVTALALGPQIDTIAPTVSAVVANSSNADLQAGNTVTLTVNFSEKVFVANGIPTLTLNDGGVASFTSGSGTSALTFTYVVEAGQNTLDLAVNGLALHGATIKDGAGNKAILTGAATSLAGILQIDTKAPTVSSIVESPAGGDLNAGNTVTLTVTFSESVTIGNLSPATTPFLTLNDLGTATYTGGSGTSALTFSYTVAAGQNTPNLTVTGLTLNGATIEDGAGNEAVLSGAMKNPAGVLAIDTTAPTVNKVVTSPGTGEVISGRTVKVTLDMSEAVTVTGLPVLLLNDGGTASYDSALSTAKALAFDYTVASEQVTTDLTVSGIQLPSPSSIEDLAGNSASLSDAGADLALRVNTKTTGPAGPSGGNFTISGNTDLEVFGASSANMTFGSGSAGTLTLDAASSLSGHGFTGNISGFAGLDALDLSDIAFGAHTTIGYSANTNNTGGVLTASDGTHTASIALLGQYMAANFAEAGDAHGGTIITDPALSALTQPNVTASHT